METLSPSENDSGAVTLGCEDTDHYNPRRLQDSQSSVCLFVCLPVRLSSLICSLHDRSVHFAKV